MDLDSCRWFSVANSEKHSFFLVGSPSLMQFEAQRKREAVVHRARARWYSGVHLGAALCNIIKMLARAWCRGSCPCTTRSKSFFFTTSTTSPAFDAARSRWAFSRKERAASSFTFGIANIMRMEVRAADRASLRFDAADASNATFASPSTPKESSSFSGEDLLTFCALRGEPSEVLGFSGGFGTSGTAEAFASVPAASASAGLSAAGGGAGAGGSAAAGNSRAWLDTAGCVAGMALSDFRLCSMYR
mmetsp:Transcript_117351/g.373917  ORF Transcript_117351/g.373917 Transcript_117351/m.373917 type:complete len:246 (+) Transcript_117351:297-1034(+)